MAHPQQASSNVIDLTGDSPTSSTILPSGRPPQAPQYRRPESAPVIEVDDDEANSEDATVANDGFEQEVEFVSERRRPAVQRSVADYVRDLRPDPQWFQMHQQNQPAPPPRARLPQYRLGRPPSADVPRHRATFQSIMERLPPFFGAGMHNNRRNFLAAAMGSVDPLDRLDGLSDEDFMAAVDELDRGFRIPELDFEAVPFDIGRNPPAAPVRPAYVAPPPPKEGFSRTPAEHDVVVCPNCDYELGQGEDGLKRQVWVARQCGHVSQIPFLSCDSY